MKWDKPVTVRLNQYLYDNLKKSNPDVSTEIRNRILSGVVSWSGHQGLKDDVSRIEAALVELSQALESIKRRLG